MTERDLSRWTPRSLPDGRPLEGRWCRLERLDPTRHSDSLYESTIAAGADDRFRYLPDYPPYERAAFDAWATKIAAGNDPLCYVVIDPATGRAEGRQTFMRIDPANGVIEIGNILWGPRIARTRMATEALYLFARHAFDDLGYRRFEWKCNALNGPSRSAAERFGFAFEGVFRQHMVVKAENRDTAWYAMLDSDWPRIRAGMEAWLAPSNFDANGAQRKALRDLTAAD
jgi:RimJ/RimL family protein N-acetyltransferase